MVNSLSTSTCDLRKVTAKFDTFLSPKSPKTGCSHSLELTQRPTTKKLDFVNATRFIEVLKAHVKRILAPCVTHYQNLLATREEQLFRMKAAQICDPLFAKANHVTVEQINNLNVFRFAAHPILATNIEGMKNELSRYKAAVDAIPPVEQRLVSKIVTKKGKKTTVQVDTFNIAKWWQEQSGTLASFALVVRAICCQSSSSCSAERVFSILNDTFTEDQRNSRADYMELSLQLQYNNRGRV